MFMLLTLVPIALATAPDVATWSQPVPRGLQVGDEQVIGGVTWRYIGQTEYSKEPSSKRGEQWVEVEEGWRDVSPRAQIVGSRRMHSDGTSWVAVDVDLDYLADLLANYPFEPTELTQDPTIAEVADEPVYEWQESDAYWTDPNSWDPAITCDDIVYHVSDGEDWGVQASATDWERSVVWVITEMPGTTQVGSCAGVLVDDYWVLTAAHCLYDDNNYSRFEEDITVCTLGNHYSGADCIAGVEDIMIGPNYFPVATNPATDYALIKVGTAFTTSFEPFVFSGAADSWVTQFTMHAHGYPAHESIQPSCDTNDDDTTVVDSSSPVAYGAELVSSYGPIAGPAFTTSFHFTIDGGDGWSGSPIWYCGDANCESGDPGAVVSVWHGWNPVYTTMVGPKARNFKDWAIMLMD